MASSATDGDTAAAVAAATQAEAQDIISESATVCEGYEGSLYHNNYAIPFDAISFHLGIKSQISGSDGSLLV